MSKPVEGKWTQIGEIALNAAYAALEIPFPVEDN